VDLAWTQLHVSCRRFKAARLGFVPDPEAKLPNCKLIAELRNYDAGRTAEYFNMALYIIYTSVLAAGQGGQLLQGYRVLPCRP
jgi:hypothetical protein